MIRLLNTFNNYSSRVFSNLVPNYAGMLRVKAGRPLVNHILNMVLLVKGSIETSLVRITVSYVRFLHSFVRRNGIPYVVKYLKASQSLLMQAISGEPHKSTRTLGLAVSRTSRGLPRFIPAVHRVHIRNGNLFYIRLWLTLISLYRVLDYTGTLKLETIIKPNNAIINFSEVYFAVSSFNTYKLFEVKPSVLKSFWINSSSPTSLKKLSNKKDSARLDKIEQGSGYSTSFPSLLLAIRAWYHNPLILSYWIEYANLMRYSGPIVNLMKYLYSLVTIYGNSELRPEHQVPDHLNIEVQGYTFKILMQNFSRLGKLAYKIEPAGKIRVFAMADAFTQWLLRPLHQTLFSFLKTLKSDATFDQTKIVNDFNSKITQLNIRKVYSFDLTAATDRIPLSVQQFILNTLYRSNVGDIWGRLLTERWYDLPFPQEDPMVISRMLLKPGFKEKYSNNIKIGSTKWAMKSVPYLEAVKYNTGQPMGALSSWAMLAVTHHTMVRIAANRAGFTDFDLYLVLGDDLVIANEKVAENYLTLAKEWDIEINLSKSVLSRNGSFEFAKRFFYKGNDVSGLSFKEMAVAHKDIRALFQMLRRIATFRTPRVSEMLSFLGHGYKALSRINVRFNKMGKGMRNSLLLASFPGSMFSKLETVTDWLIQPRFNGATKLILDEPTFKSLKSWMISGLRNLKDNRLPFGVPATHKIIEYMPTHLLGIITYYNAPGSQVRALSHFLAFSVHQMLFDIQSRFNEIKLESTKLNHSVQMNANVIEELWRGIELVEDSQSLISDYHEFRETKEIITIGNSSLLKRANHIRAAITALNEKTYSSVKR